MLPQFSLSKISTDPPTCPDIWPAIIALLWDNRRLTLVLARWDLRLDGCGFSQCHQVVGWDPTFLLKGTNKKNWIWRKHRRARHSGLLMWWQTLSGPLHLGQVLLDVLHLCQDLPVSPLTSLFSWVSLLFLLVFCFFGCPLALCAFLVEFAESCRCWRALNARITHIYTSPTRNSTTWGGSQDGGVH